MKRVLIGIAALVMIACDKQATISTTTTSPFARIRQIHYDAAFKACLEFSQGVDKEQFLIGFRRGLDDGDLTPGVYDSLLQGCKDALGR